MITSYQPSSRPVLQSNETFQIQKISIQRIFELCGPSSKVGPANLINDSTRINGEVRVNGYGNWCLKNHWAASTDILGMLHKPVYVRYAVKLLS